MKIGIQQPYFMPYIGYWQRINAVDTHVIFDDVNYIKRGWAHRNKILINGQVSNINLPVLGASQNKLFNEIKLDTDKKIQDKLVKKIELSYKKAPFYMEAMGVIEEVLRTDSDNLAVYLEKEIRMLSSYMGINTNIIRSSFIEKDNSLKGEKKIVDICKRIGGKESITYINASSGEHLYSREEFKENGIELLFIEDRGTVSYSQLSKNFVPSLSIIDVIMNCSKEQIYELLNDYKIY